MSILPKPSFCLLSDCAVQAEPLGVIGKTYHGLRRVIAITGAWFDGVNMSSEGLPRGSDWQLIRKDGVVSIESRYMLQKDDFALVFVRNRGVKVAKTGISAKLDGSKDAEPSEYRLRTRPTFENGAEEFMWLNSVFAIASAARRPRGAELAVFEVL